MKTIKFSTDELEFLRNHYELELLDAENYITDIKNILKKLGVDQKPEIPEKPKKKRGRPRKVKEEGRGKREEVKVVEKKAPKKTGPKPKKVKVIKEKKVVKPENKTEIKPEIKLSAKPAQKSTPKKKETPRKKSTPKKNLALKKKTGLKKQETKPAEPNLAPVVPTMSN